MGVGLFTHDEIYVPKQESCQLGLFAKDLEHRWACFIVSHKMPAIKETGHNAIDES